MFGGVGEIVSVVTLQFALSEADLESPSVNSDHLYFES